MLPPKEEKIGEALKSLKLRIFDLEAGLHRNADQEHLVKIAQNLVLSASVIHQLVSLPSLPRFERAVLRRAAGKSS